MLESDTTHLTYLSHDPERQIARRLKALLGACLAALSIAYLGKGFFYGIFLNGEGSDVLRRWLEERFVLGAHIDSPVAAGFVRRGVVYPPRSLFSAARLF